MFKCTQAKVDSFTVYDFGCNFAIVTKFGLQILFTLVDFPEKA